jgi:hypothetical protein
MSEFEIHPPSHGVEVAFEDEGVNFGKILVIGILSLILFVGALAVLDDIFSIARESEIKAVDLAIPSEQLKAMRNTESATLNSYKLLDSTKATYGIPIDRAMRLVAGEDFEDKAGGADNAQ